MIWFLLIPLWFSTNVLAYILAPVLPAFASLRFGATDNGNAVGIEPRLPDWLSWFMTPDNSLLGDATYKELNDSGYWSQVRWLWRNPCVGFEASVLSAQLGTFVHLIAWGDPQVHDAPEGKEGYCFVRIGNYWNLVYIKRFGNRCLKLDLGWQLKTFAEGHPLEPTARYAASIRLPLFIR